MGIGFWLIQALFVVAAIATAIQVERERHGPAREGRQLPVQPGAIFTVQEQVRLDRLRQRIRESRFGTGRLYDDLIPDPISSEVRQPEEEPPAHVRAPVPVTALVVAGLLLVGVGAAGTWWTNAGMPPAANASAIDRFVPGPLADPARYFAAVNSATTSARLESAALAMQKQAMDRWEASLFAGIALLLAVGAHGAGEQRDPSPIVIDLVGVFSLLAVVWAGLSFFELA
jgi:hypothetical protein